jgi:hypothetical protein
VNGRSTTRASLFDIAAGVVVALAYGVLSEPFEFTLGLLVVGFAGGWLIGSAVAYGAWSGKEHERVPSLQWAAVALSIVSWVGALALAFAISQALLPGATTPLSSRLTFGGFLDYFNGLDLTRLIHLVALALMAFMARRGAR